MTAHEKILRIRAELKNDVKLAALLGMCKVTLYKRLRTGEWKLAELALIKTLKIPK